MIIYCSNFRLQPHTTLEEIAEVIARWLGIKAKCFVQPKDLIKGAEQRLRDGSQLESQSTVNEPQSFPLLFSVKFSHAGDVPGRQWSTEIGVRQNLPNAPLQCSILLQTHEISARVTAPIQPTRPNVVEELFRRCNPLPGTPGVQEHYLDEHNAKAFLHALEHSSRESPWIIVSPTKDGKHLLNVKRLRSLLLGVAEVFEIPAGTNTFDLQEKIGIKYAVWLGAANVIFPSRRTQGKAFYDTYRFVPEQISSLIDEGRSPESELFSVVTHRTNLPNSWKHVSPAAVANAKLRQHLNAGIATIYWEDLASGKPDAEARKVFGNAYAAKEADSLSSEGRKRRTFTVDGRPIEMLRHLKIGVKDSASETLRVHFEWIGSERKIAIGHCGAHLDF